MYIFYAWVHFIYDFIINSKIFIIFSYDKMVVNFVTYYSNFYGL